LLGGLLKKLVAAITLLATALLGVQPTSANVRDMSDSATLSWQVEESYGDTYSQVVISQKDSRGFWSDGNYCSEFGPGKVARFPQGASCDPTTYRGDILIQFSSLQAPVCLETSNNCLESVFATNAQGNRVMGKFLGYVSKDYWVPANPTLGNPLGVTAGIWQIPGVINSTGTDLYEVHLNMEGGMVAFKNGRQQNKFSLKNRQFNAGIRPVNATVSGDVATKNPNCGNCNALPADYSFGLTTILPESVMNWYSGRLQNADVVYQRVDSTYFRITVTGSPIEIPEFKGKIAKGQASDQLLKQFHWCQSNAPDCFGLYTNGYGNEATWTDFLDAWRPLVEDTATGSATVWTVRTVPVYFGPGGDRGFYNCTPKNRAAGIVSTNALMYNGMIPSFERGFFNYRVAGMHYEADGKTEFLGRYEMVMDEQLARCMFKFPRAPISATVTVSGEDGENVVATSLVNSSNGKLRLAAYNFTFSEKTIKIKLGAQGHLTCTKGKTTRYVKGSRCPAGFKRG
jgi:hypothetical protein